MSDSSNARKIILNTALFLATQAAMYYSVQWLLDYASSSRKDSEAEVLKRLGYGDLKLDEFERTISREVIHPDKISVRFVDIGGLEPIISSLRESVIYPLLYPTLFTSASTLLGPPKGVLLYGPPGCGKTMLARALAKESGATFINVPASTLTSKWFGESNRLVAGLWSLARKLQPCIIFIDEIDSFMRERSREDHEVMGMMKAEFMTSWDGLLSGTDRILVLGATNRPHDIDSAILRRMPKRYAVGLPDADQRYRILSLMLKDSKLEPIFSLRLLAEKTIGYSGSDLRELCRNAAMIPMRECMRGFSDNPEIMERIKVEGFNIRPLSMNDFYNAEGSTISPRDDLPPTPSSNTASTPGHQEERSQILQADRSRLDSDVEEGALEPS